MFRGLAAFNRDAMLDATIQCHDLYDVMAPANSMQRGSTQVCPDRFKATASIGSNLQLRLACTFSRFGHMTWYVYTDHNVKAMRSEAVGPVLRTLHRNWHGPEAAKLVCLTEGRPDWLNYCWSEGHGRHS